MKNPTTPKTPAAPLFRKANGNWQNSRKPNYIKAFEAGSRDPGQAAIGVFGLGFKPLSNTSKPGQDGKKMGLTAKRADRLKETKPFPVLSESASDPREPDRDALYRAATALKPFLSALLGDDVMAPPPEPAPEGQAYPMFTIKHGSSRGWVPCTLIEFMERFKTNPAQACYTNTATVTMGTQQDDNTKPALRHGAKHFVEQRFIILDDIGTGPGAKCNPDDLLPAFRNPTTIVETSPGNYQYGYRWVQPIKDIALAAEITKAIYAAGRTHGWDTGGALASKFIRLPIGVNGKRETRNGKPGFANAKTWFPCRLVECNPENTFDPVALALAISHDVNAPEHSSARALSRMHRKAGHTSVTFDGIIDPFLEKLELVGQVIGDAANGVYKDVVCPGADKHTDTKDITAGYKPIGVPGTRGDEDGIYQRHFKCFHDSCADFSTRDYISYMETRFDDVFVDPTPTRDASAKLAREWAYVTGGTKHTGGAYVRLADGLQWSTTQFAETYRAKAPGTKVALAALFRSSPLRLEFDRLELRPDIKDWIFTDSNGHRVLNTFRRIPLKSVPREPGFMDRWLEFHRRIYGEASDAILDGWAYKYQHPEWTGYAELGIGQVHGTGRTSFMQTYMEMWRHEYVATLPMKHLALDWGNYQTKLLVVVNEVCASDANRFELAEKFKEDIDTTPGRRTDVNIKGGAILEGQRVFAHWIMFSNHLGAIHVEESDRRILITDSGHIRMTREEKAEFWEGYWKKDIEYSKTQLHYFLLDRDLSGFDPFMDAPHTLARARMISKTTLAGGMVDAILDNWLECANARGISASQMMEAMNRAMRSRFLKETLPANWRKQARAHLQSRTVQTNDYWQVRKADKRPWVDTGKNRDKPNGPPRGWCTKQNVLLIQRLLKVNVNVAGCDVDWDRLVVAVLEAVESEEGSD